jgi:hypothetical protein
MFIKYREPDCSKFSCDDACCRFGVDVWPEEAENLIAAGVATAADFTGPEADDAGDVLFRTALGPRGCVFLKDGRGCRLHGTPLKPITCVKMPSSDEDIEYMLADGIMPCCETGPAA